MKPKIRRIGIFGHPTRSTVPALIKQILKWARESDVEIRLSPRMAKKTGHPELGVSYRDMSALVDMIVVLGGDGTILQTVRTFARDGLPIAGINLGHLGFLTLGDAKNALSVLERLKRGNFRIENRMIIRTIVRLDGEQVFEGFALNDIVIAKGNVLRVIGVDVSISGTDITSFRGDGVIFSTPTGSTAYSLSAGGPIVPPWVNVMLICPLNSHTLGVRPVITSDQEVVLAKVECSHSKVDLVIDGQEGFPLCNGDEIEVARAQELGRIVVFRTRNFFQVLRQKMKWGK